MELQYLTDKEGNIISVVVPIDDWYKILGTDPDVQNLVDGIEPQMMDEEPESLAEFLVSNDINYRTVGLVRFFGQMQKWTLAELKKLENEIISLSDKKEFAADARFFVDKILESIKAQIIIVIKNSN